MQLLASWKQSLGILYPFQNLQIFLLAVIRAIHFSAVQWINSFWWLIALSVFVDVVGIILDFPVYIQIFSAILGAGAVTSLFLTIRPSVGRKDLDYWKQHTGHFLVGVGVTIFFYAIRVLEVPFLENVFVFYFFLPLWFFFFFDSPATVSDFFIAWKRTFLMVIYALPLWLIVTFFMPHVFVVDPLWVAIIFRILSPVFACIGGCIWSVFYIMLLRRQPTLYFNEPTIKES